MKKYLILLTVLLAGKSAWAYYDFCQPPQDYNTFPPLYDVRTEYWKDIPNYNNNKVQYKNPEIELKQNYTCPTRVYTDSREKENSGGGIIKIKHLK